MKFTTLNSTITPRVATISTANKGTTSQYVTGKPISPGVTVSPALKTGSISPRTFAGQIAVNPDLTRVMPKNPLTFVPGPAISKGEKTNKIIMWGGIVLGGMLLLSVLGVFKKKPARR